MAKYGLKDVIMILGAISFGEGLHIVITPDFWGQNPNYYYFSAFFYFALGIGLMLISRKNKIKIKKSLPRI